MRHAPGILFLQLQMYTHTNLRTDILRKTSLYLYACALPSLWKATAEVNKRSSFALGGELRYSERAAGMREAFK